MFIKITAMRLFLILYLNGFKWTLTYLMNRDLSEVVKKAPAAAFEKFPLYLAISIVDI